MKYHQFATKRYGFYCCRLYYN